MKEVILSVKDLKIYYPCKVKEPGKLLMKKVPLQAVDGISFDAYKGETLGIVGESGCGKSTTGRAIVRQEKPIAGEIIYAGKNIWDMNAEELFAYRSKVQMIFQDVYSTLDPRFTIGQSICEPLKVHKYGSSKECKSLALRLMQDVGLPESYYDRYPHEFSGGQRQRIGIARALALNPQLLVCDEPVSALDVSIQAQILNQMKDLQKKYDLTYIFISHNLSVVKYLCDRIGVIYLGVLVELATKEELFGNMMHPYTQALIEAIPIPDPKYRHRKNLLQGDVPTPINPPKGCPFVTRCSYATSLCAAERPACENVGDDHFVACHMYGSKKQKMASLLEEKGIEVPKSKSAFINKNAGE